MRCSGGHSLEKTKKSCCYLMLLLLAAAAEEAGALSLLQEDRTGQPAVEDTEDGGRDSN